MKCSDIKIGSLREPIIIQRKTNVSDGAGGYTETWAAISNSPTKAAVKALSGSERLMSDRIEAGTKWRVTIRYFAGLKESDRIVIRSRNYNIRFINNIELMDRWMVIDLDGGAAI